MLTHLFGSVDASSIVSGNVDQTRNLLWKVQRELTNKFLIRVDSIPLDAEGDDDEDDDDDEEDEEENRNKETFSILIRWVTGGYMCARCLTFRAFINL